MLSTSIRFSLPALTLMSVSLVAFGLTGCGAQGEEDPTIAAVEALGDGTDAAHAMGRPGMGGLAGSNEPEKHLGMRCDASPEITTENVCGFTIPQSAHFEWTACQPVSAEAAGHPVGSTSGQVDVTNSVVVDPEANCAAGTEATFEHMSTFAIERQTRFGTASIEGSASSSSTHAFGATSYQRSTTIDVTRQMVDADGAVQRSMHITGSSNVAIDDAAAVPTRTLNGTMNVEFADGRTGTVTLVDVVRVDPTSCRFPLSGTATREVGGETHTVVFGPDCGQATMDGELVDLSEQRMGGGRPR